jgi:peptide-methionine (R)-S-oxide reductase
LIFTEKIDTIDQVIKEETMGERIVKSEEEWRTVLSPEVFRILRKKGTEKPFTGRYYEHHEKGIYVCAGCGNPLFSSESKFQSESGWPSFTKPISKERIQTEEDHSFGMVRIEVLCARCGGHLGHVFRDGPPPTGMRYCINSLSMNFEKATTEETNDSLE